MNKNIILLLAAVLMVSCGKSTDKTVINTNEIKSKKTTNTIKAEELALAAEKLITPISLLFADKVLDEALELDSQNERALLYKKAIAPLLKFKGVVKRTAFITKDIPSLQNKIDKRMSKIPNPRITEFLNMGVEDITTEKDVQAFVLDMYLALDELRMHLKTKKDLEIELNVPYTVMNRDQKTIAACKITANAGVYTLENCRVSESTPVKLNRADIETLQHVTAGVQIDQLIATAYNLEGAIKTIGKIVKVKPNQEAVWAELTSHPGFGKLSETHKLDLITRLGNEAVLGFKWAKKIQDEICASGITKKNQRSGFLFSRGLCTSETVHVSSRQTMKAFELANYIEQSLAGEDTAIAFADSKSKVKLSVIWNSPVEDLRNLGPVFGARGQFKTLLDKKAGGLLPNADFNRVFENRQNIIIE